MLIKGQFDRYSRIDCSKRKSFAAQSVTIFSVDYGPDDGVTAASGGQDYVDVTPAGHERRRS
jgi:hypothetical protein